MLVTTPNFKAFLNKELGIRVSLHSKMVIIMMENSMKFQNLMERECGNRLMVYSKAFFKMEILELAQLCIQTNQNSSEQ